MIYFSSGGHVCVGPLHRFYWFPVKTIIHGNNDE
jgi:hypothetical protein